MAINWEPTCSEKKPALSSHPRLILHLSSGGSSRVGEAIGQVLLSALRIKLASRGWTSLTLLLDASNDQVAVKDDGDGILRLKSRHGHMVMGNVMRTSSSELNQTVDRELGDGVVAE